MFGISANSRKNREITNIWWRSTYREFLTFDSDSVTPNDLKIVYEDAGGTYFRLFCCIVIVILLHLCTYKANFIVFIIYFNETIMLLKNPTLEFRFLNDHIFVSRKKGKVNKCQAWPRFELGSLDSESRVLVFRPSLTCMGV